MNKSGKKAIRRMLAKLLDEKMGAYSAAAAAVLLAGGTSAKAAVQATALSPHVTLIGPNSRYPVDFNGDGITDVSLHLLTMADSSERTAYKRVWTTNTLSATVGNFRAGLPGPAGPTLAAAMSADLPVAEPYWQGAPALLARYHHQVIIQGTVNDTTSQDTTSQDANFLGLSDRYLGVKFDVGPDTHYGWVQVGVDAMASEATVTAHAWNDVPLGPIAAGEVPEPTSLSLLALGAAGVAARRRKKRPE